MEELRFRFADPDRRLAGVRLWQRIGLSPVEFGYDEAAGEWTLTVARPAAWRIEYLLELRGPDGSTELVCDPANERRVGGAFGDKSVIEFPDYVEPAWLRAPAAEGHWRELAIAAPPLGGDVWSRVWSPDRPTDLVLVAHDGPEYDKLAALGQYSAALIAAGTLPPHHLVLLAPGERNEWYSANPAYVETLVDVVIPRLSTRPVVAMGASLGALALLHAHHQRPGAFAGLFLQSGSFFLPRFDPQERGFSQYQRIIRFVGTAIRDRAAPVPTVLTCGSVEENLANNRHMACVLDAPLAEVPDGHNFTAWRDALDPHLTGLLKRVWHA
jgi:enterochelin esterase-like enzyme